LDKWAVEIPAYAIKLALRFWPGPMTLVLPRSGLAKNFITGKQDNVAIRVPAHAVALSLLKEFESQGGNGVVAPSANRFGKVSPTCANDVRTELSNYLIPGDLILDGGPSRIGVESTIINCTQNIPRILRPGAITTKMINELLDTAISTKIPTSDKHIKVPGLLDSHYSPSAKVYLSGLPQPGDGFIALNTTLTPPGVIRLASPMNNEDYARVLYQALNLADKMKLLNVIVIPPSGDDIALAVRDRLQKAATKLS
jgi:L-threonylcarbamoyladenylate synthase